MTDHPGHLAADAASSRETAVVAADRRPAYVVGVGASAGGLEALERLFSRMPADTGLAFVVVQHLSPDFKSLTDELLARHTAIPIRQVQNGMPIERDTIYLMPPKKDMIMANGRLLLADKDRTQLVTLPIDHFFRSLAQDAGDHAIGIVLSGTGSDGSRGVRDIHDAGGLVLVQSVESAKFDGMPKSAINTGAADLILPPEEMAAALRRYVEHPFGRGAAPLQPSQPLPTGMDAIFRLLRNAFGIEFAHYKPDTVARRLERRILLAHSISLDDYIARLEADPAELTALYRDLLIGVTHFFRDRDAFARLEQTVLPALIQRSPADDEFRIWCAGCATGEEAYSLAMLAYEQLEAANRPLNLKVFATDVHRDSLDVASNGWYSDAMLADTSPARRERFFVRRGDGYQVSQELRKLVVFAQHNILKDAPFTRLNLISCRNLLIYFQPPAQKKALTMLHFGLRAGGVLFLGPSETPGELADEFEPLDQRWKLYRKCRDVRLSAELAAPAPHPGVAVRPPAASGWPLGGASVDAYEQLLDTYMPVGLLVNEDRVLVHTFGGAGRYLKMKDGRFSGDVLDIVDEEVRIALAGGLPKAFRDRQPFVYKALRVRTAAGEERVNLTVEPLRQRRPGPAHALVRFDAIDTAAASAPPAREVDLDRASSDQILTLESELRSAKENLQAMVEEMETSNEELQATNEELVASNEELQSTNEELHSVNEELYTVNAEYQKKIAELTVLTNDMENLLASTEVHTIFLDRDLCIRKFTPKIAETFNLFPQDIGRRIDNFTHTLDHPGLLDDLRAVLASGTRIERQVRNPRGQCFLLRILPYRSAAGIDGVVATLIDVSDLKQAEAAARGVTEQLTGILRHSPKRLFVAATDGRLILASESLRAAVDRDPIGCSVHELFPPDAADAMADCLRRVVFDGQSATTELILADSGVPRDFLLVAFPLRDGAGAINGVGGILSDVTEIKKAERDAREAVDQRDRFLAMLSHELRNPLAAILNALGMIEAAAPAEPVHRWVQVIERRTRHMGRLLDDLLDVSRITQNKIELRRDIVDLVRCANDAIEEVQPLFDEAQVRLHVELPEQPAWVDGDPTRLQQIQVNLLRNAAKFTPPGGDVWFTVARDGDDAVIRVRDTGCGIPADMLETVFQLFVQSPANGQMTGGIGVGLTLVREIVSAHGGSVRAASDGPGAGSEFVVRLPLAPSGAAPSPSKPAPVPRLSSSAAILIVEDDADIRESLAALLRLDGYDVATAADGPAALDTMASRSFDAALVDIGLPGYDGFELARRIHRRFGELRPRLIALTGYGQPNDRQLSAAAGFEAHLTKPIRPAELSALLQTIGRRKLSHLASERRN